MTTPTTTTFFVLNARLLLIFYIPVHLPVDVSLSKAGMTGYEGGRLGVSVMPASREMFNCFRIFEIRGQESVPQRFATT